MDYTEAPRPSGTSQVEFPKQSRTPIPGQYNIISDHQLIIEAPSAPPRGYYLDLQALAKPRPTLFTSPRRPLPDLILLRMNFWSTRAGRRLTSPECDVLAQRTAFDERTVSYITMVAPIVGLVRWYQTQSTFQYPYMTRSIFKRFDPNKFLSMGAAASRSAWNSVRLGAYYFVFSTVYGSIGQAYILGTAPSKILMDSRMADLKNELAKRYKAGMMIPGPQQDRQGFSEQTQDGGTPEMPMQAQTYTVPESTPPPARAPQPDMMPQPDRTPQASLLDTFDDASPVAREDSSGQSSSAWDRLRHDPNNSSRRADRQNQNAWSALRSSPTSTQPSQPDRNLSERERAQRAFDAQLERERKTQDGDDDKWL